MALPELAALTTRLREGLGDHAFEALLRPAETMTIAAIAAYAYGQIDRARAELEDAG
ncbi:hypothetical protein [Mycobacterium asiaticum]|uniref:hypothetical protein n=1 Tax=Mycobacterium asiaticum TaxID=1790 RepID=UPI0012DB180B|nr:hypothetical protein [Mycobacterium asiaticum]